MTNLCQPTNAPLSITSPCAMLPLLRGALFELIGGKARARVRMGEQELAFHPANIAELRKEIMRLEAICTSDGQPDNRGRAMGTLRRQAGSLGFPNGFNRYR